MSPRTGKWTHGTARIAGAIAAAAVIQMQGCESAPMSGRGYSRTIMSAADEAFADGANRPPTAKTLFALSRLMESQQRYAEAEVVLARTIQRFPEFTPAYIELALQKVRQGKLNDALAIVQLGADHSTDDPILQNNLGMCLMMKGDHEDALEAFRQAVKLDPEHRGFICNTAVALGMLGRYEECLATYEHAISAARAHYNLAVICEARDDVERAAEEYAKASELHPGIRRQSFDPVLTTAASRAEGRQEAGVLIDDAGR